MERTYYNIHNSNKALRNRLRKGWRLRRLHRWLQEQYPYHGTTLITAYILAAAKEEGVVWSERSINEATTDISAHQKH